MKYHNITYDDMLNGEGLRVVLWVSGCEHTCKGCHNETTWDLNDGIEFDEEAKKELFGYLNRDYIKGITFSGGDPLHIKNRDEILALAKEIKEYFIKKDIWLYTGYTWQEITDLEILNYVDILVDGKFEEGLFDANLEWRGSSNQRVINVKKTLVENKVITY